MTLQEEASSYLHAVIGTALFVWLYLENDKTVLVSGMGCKAGILSEKTFILLLHWLSPAGKVAAIRLLQSFQLTVNIAVTMLLVGLGV